MFKFKISLERHDARQNLNYYVLPDPPLFSLPSTFKDDLTVILFLSVSFMLIYMVYDLIN